MVSFSAYLSVFLSRQWWCGDSILGLFKLYAISCNRFFDESRAEGMEEHSRFTELAIVAIRQLRMVLGPNTSLFFTLLCLRSTQNLLACVSLPYPLLHAFEMTKL